MTLSRQFLSRYAKIQKGLQERAELELAQAMQARAQLEQHLRASEEHCESAQLERNQCTRAEDLQRWHQYVQALQVHLQSSRTQVVDAQAREQAGRDAVSAAYREARRWEIMSDRTHKAHTEQLSKAGQREADELASQRAGRG
jgi:flagellar export protein FliJ